MMGPVSVITFSQLLDFLTLFILPAFVEKQILLIMFVSIINPFFNAGELPFDAILVPFDICLLLA